MKTRIRLRVAVALVTLCVTGAVSRAQHSGDVWIGRTSGDQLGISPAGLVPEQHYYTLSPVSGLLNGWSDNSPGFDRITSDDPEQDFYPLEPGCAIWLEVVTMDPAFRMIDGGFQFLDTPGDATYLGDHTLHVHNTWHINSDDPVFDPNRCVWRAVVILRDDGSTGYAPSAPCQFNFANLPWGPGLDPPVWADGDCDEDEDVDLIDFAAFCACMNGPGHFPAPTDASCALCEVECANAFDFGESHDEVDLDVDLADFAAFQSTFGGAR